MDNDQKDVLILYEARRIKELYAFFNFFKNKTIFLLKLFVNIFNYYF